MLKGGEVVVGERDWPLVVVRVEVASSVTTGEFRMVSLSVAQLVFGAMGSALRLGHLPGDVWLCCLPLHHVGGLSIVLRRRACRRALLRVVRVTPLQDPVSRDMLKPEERRLRQRRSQPSRRASCPLSPYHAHL